LVQGGGGGVAKDAVTEIRMLTIKIYQDAACFYVTTPRGRRWCCACFLPDKREVNIAGRGRSWFWIIWVLLHELGHWVFHALFGGGRLTKKLDKVLDFAEDKRQRFHDVFCHHRNENRRVDKKEK